NLPLFLTRLPYSDPGLVGPLYRTDRGRGIQQAQPSHDTDCSLAVFSHQCLGNRGRMRLRQPFRFCIGHGSFSYRARRTLVPVSPAVRCLHPPRPPTVWCYNKAYMRCDTAGFDSDGIGSWLTIFCQWLGISCLSITKSSKTRESMRERTKQRIA